MKRVIILKTAIIKEDTFFCSKFSSFSKCQQNRCSMCLKASDGLWITCLANDINGLQSKQHRQPSHRYYNHAE